jgi:hypothetical protein
VDPARIDVLSYSLIVENRPLVSIQAGRCHTPAGSGAAIVYATADIRLFVMKRGSGRVTRLVA